MKPPSTILMQSSRESLFSGHEAIEYGREMRLRSFSAKIERNGPGSKSNTGSFSNVNRMRYVWGNFGAMSKTSFTITVCLPDRNLTGVSWTTGFCGVTAFAGAVPRIIAKLGTRQANLNISSRVARIARHTNAHRPRADLSEVFRGRRTHRGRPRCRPPGRGRSRARTS